MKSSNEDIGQIVAVVVQTIGAAAACVLLTGWAWSLAAGSVLGFTLLFLLGALFVPPWWRGACRPWPWARASSPKVWWPLSIGAVLALDLRACRFDPAAKLHHRQTINLTRLKPEPPRQ